MINAGSIHFIRKNISVLDGPVIEESYEINQIIYLHIKDRYKAVKSIHITVALIFYFSQVCKF